MNWIKRNWYDVSCIVAIVVIGLCVVKSAKNLNDSCRGRAVTVRGGEGLTAMVKSIRGEHHALRP